MQILYGADLVRVTVIKSSWSNLLTKSSSTTSSYFSCSRVSILQTRRDQTAALHAWNTHINYVAEKKDAKSIRKKLHCKIRTRTDSTIAARDNYQQNKLETWNKSAAYCDRILSLILSDAFFRELYDSTNDLSISSSVISSNSSSCLLKTSLEFCRRRLPLAFVWGGPSEEVDGFEETSVGVKSYRARNDHCMFHHYCTIHC